MQWHNIHEDAFYHLLQITDNDMEPHSPKMDLRGLHVELFSRFMQQK